MSQDHSTKGNWFVRHKVLTVVLAVFIGLLFIRAAAGDSVPQSNTAANTSTPAAAPAAQPAAEPTRSQQQPKPDNSISGAVARIQQANAADGACTYTDSRKTNTSISSNMKDATTNFVNLGRALDFSVCKSFTYTLAMPVDGSTADILVLTVDKTTKPVLDAYNLDAITNTAVGKQLNHDSMVGNWKLGIDGVKVEYVVYAGTSDQLRL